MDFMSFIVEQGLVIAAALYVVGEIFKRIPQFPDWLIPVMLMVLGILAAGFSLNGGFHVENIMQGVFAAGAAVLANQTIKQVSKRE